MPGAVAVLAVIQARMGSTRAPGKVMRPLAGRPVLAWVVRAAQAAWWLDQVVVATTADPRDDPVALLAADLGVGCTRGSEDDVLARFVQAVDEHPADAVVRLTADCPLLDPALIDAVAEAWLGDQTLDYVSTVLPRTLPRGLDVELARADTLRALAQTATGVDRVHVTSGLYAAPDRFRLRGLQVADPPADDLRVTLDTDADAQALDALVALLGDRPPAWREVVDTLRAHPEVVALNAHVEQKAVEAG